MREGGSVNNLSIIMVSYNTKQITLDSLHSLFEQTEGITYEVIVLDNDSSDGSAEAIADAFPQVKLIVSKDNLGFAQGNNVAIREATGEYLLLLNPDTVVLNGAIQKLLAFAGEYPDAKIWGGRTQFKDGSLNKASCWGRMTFWSLFCSTFGLTWAFPNSQLFHSEAYGGWPRDSVRHVDIVSGCFFMIEKAFWHKMNGFSREFFMYGEEADLCLRASAFGAKPIITPDATIVHYGGASEKARADKMVRLFTAKVKLIRNHWSPWMQSMGVGLIAISPLSRLAVLSLLRVSGKKSAIEAYEVWRLIWRKRDHWLQGKWDIS